MNILVVDDDSDLVDVLSFALKRGGFSVFGAHDPPTALGVLDRYPVDFALLDVNLDPPGDGFELLQTIRARSQIPIIMLTARGAEEDKLRGLHLGADDYLVKPFSHRELIARIETVARRMGLASGGPIGPKRLIEAGPFWLDAGGHQATKHGAPLKLTVTEFRLLHVLMLHADTVLPVRTLLREVWGYGEEANADVLRVAVYRLRRKVEEDPSSPGYLQAIPGVGVVLRTAPEPADPPL